MTNRAVLSLLALSAALAAVGCGNGAAKKDDHLPSVTAAVVEAVDLQE
jgi:hypothetical protein